MVAESAWFSTGFVDYGSFPANQQYRKQLCAVGWKTGGRLCLGLTRDIWRKVASSRWPWEEPKHMRRIFGLQSQVPGTLKNTRPIGAPVCLAKSVQQWKQTKALEAEPLPFRSLVLSHIPWQLEPWLRCVGLEPHQLLVPCRRCKFLFSLPLDNAPLPHGGGKELTSALRLPPCSCSPKPCRSNPSRCRRVALGSAWPVSLGHPPRHQDQHSAAS